MAFGKAGKSKRRANSRRELFENILIVTDGEATETNYFSGLRDSFPVELRRKIRIRIVPEVNTQDLVETTLAELRKDPAVREAWIVFDRDNRPEDFDTVISKAKRNGINVGWSNPCIEIFFHAYYGKMPRNEVPQQCISAFGRDFERKTGKEYEKNDEDIYEELRETGDEEGALALSKATLETSSKNAESKRPSKYCPASTLHELVGKAVKFRVNRKKPC